MRTTPTDRQYRFEDYRDLISQEVGLWYSDDRAAELERGLEQALRTLALDSHEELRRELAQGDSQVIKTVSESLTIGETYFYRDASFFQNLEERFTRRTLPARCLAQKRLRIWSAGCSTGEEPYSIAIALRRCLLGLQNWDVRILGTDMNEKSLKKAAEARYGKWSFRDTPEWLRPRYFEAVEQDKHRPLPMVRELVEFRPLNLAKDHFPSAFNSTHEVDILLCRNCLMYLAPDQARRAVERFVSALAPGGYLVVSPVDVGLLAGLPLESESGGFYRKVVEQTRPAQPEFELPELVSQLPTPPEEPIHPGRRGLRLLQSGLLEPAAMLFREQLEREPADQEFAALLAFTLTRQNRLEEARQWAQRSLNTPTAERYRLLAAILHREGQTREGYEALRKSLYLDPDEALSHQLAGILLNALGQAGRADKHFRKAQTLGQRKLSSSDIPENLERLVGIC